MINDNEHRVKALSTLSASSVGWLVRWLFSRSFVRSFARCRLLKRHPLQNCWTVSVETTQEFEHASCREKSSLPRRPRRSVRLRHIQWYSQKAAHGKCRMMDDAIAWPNQCRFIFPIVSPLSRHRIVLNQNEKYLSPLFCSLTRSRRRQKILRCSAAGAPKATLSRSSSSADSFLW